MDSVLKIIHWIHHSSFRIEMDGKIIYIDPFKVKNTAAKADLILITHGHYDHFSQPDIDALVKDTTQVVCPREVADELNASAIKTVKPGDVFESGSFRITAVPAYNIGKSFHIKDSGKVGYVLETGNVRIYHAGDTDATPEMKALKNIGIAMLPVGGTYTMTASEAAEAVNEFKPGIAIPMHWGNIVGSKKDAEEFKRLAKIRVEILEKEE
jgi:L-ascorbate metabolism protein UlaG (beta-lactamase superfamily)